MDLKPSEAVYDRRMEYHQTNPIELDETASGRAAIAEQIKKN